MKMPHTGHNLAKKYIFLKVQKIKFVHDFNLPNLLYGAE